jgi:hypothetical protein
MSGLRHSKLLAWFAVESVQCEKTKSKWGSVTDS